MASTTTKFGFTLPDGSDVFDKDKYLNGNFNLVESEIYSKTEADNNYAKKSQTPSYTAISWQNGWSSTGYSSGDPVYWKSDAGIIYIKGSAKPPVSGFQNVNMFTLPVGYRPSTTMNFYLGATAVVSVYPTGNVQYTASTAVNVDFGCISFPHEQ